MRIIGHAMFCDLIDRLKAACEEKYPDRIWDAEMYFNVAFEWVGKEVELEKRVIKLEKENELRKNSSKG
jgi:hypothetical protein